MSNHTTGHFYFAQISHRKKTQILHRKLSALQILCKICTFFLCEICAKPDFGKMSSSVMSNTCNLPFIKEIFKSTLIWVYSHYLRDVFSQTNYFQIQTL